MEDKQEVKIIPNQVVKVRWNAFAPVYTNSDSSNQTFFYTLVNMLQVGNAKNILQIGCGAGKLIPYLNSLKQLQCKYYASDISQTMIDLAKKFLQGYIQKLGVTQSIENWMARHSLDLHVLNGQDKIQVPYKFDRIICNLVLQTTQNPQNMLKNLCAVAQPGCLLGVSIWGQKKSNEALTHLGRPIPNARSNFHLFNRLQEIAQQSGWEVVVQWQQNAPYPYYQMQAHLKELNDYSSLNDKDIIEYTQKKINDTFNQKKILNFAAQLAILRRK